MPILEDPQSKFIFALFASKLMKNEAQQKIPFTTNFLVTLDATQNVYDILVTLRPGKFVFTMTPFVRLDKLWWSRNSNTFVTWKQCVLKAVDNIKKTQNEIVDA